MSPFDYLSVLISVIVGLGLSHLLTGAARLIQMRQEVRVYPPTLLWMATLFLVEVQIWWVSYMSRAEDWTFFSFLFFLVVPVLGYLLCYLVIPDLAAERVNLRASYHANRVWFFGLLAGVVAVTFVQDLVENAPVLDPNGAFRLAFLVLALAAIFVRREWFHLANAVLGLVLFTAYVLVNFLQLR